MERNIRLHPRDLGANLREKVAAQLLRDVEGKCSGAYGYVVAVTGLKRVGAGQIISGTTYVTFPVRYDCLICRPFRREVFEGVVTRVIANGFFAECGPLNLFVSSFCMPEGRYELERGHDGEFRFVDNELGERIAPGAEVRVAVMGTRFDATQISCIGTMRGDYLGVVRSAQ